MTAADEHAEGAGRPAPSAVLDLATAEDDCGDPALARVRRVYEQLAPGAVLEARSPIAEHAFAVRTWAQRAGAELVTDERQGATTVLRVRRPR